MLNRIARVAHRVMALGRRRLIIGTSVPPEMSSSILTATGSDYGLLDVKPNLNRTGYYHIYASGMTSLAITVPTSSCFTVPCSKTLLISCFNATNTMQRNHLVWAGIIWEWRARFGMACHWTGSLRIRRICGVPWGAVRPITLGICCDESRDECGASDTQWFGRGRFCLGCHGTTLDRWIRVRRLSRCGLLQQWRAGESTVALLPQAHRRTELYPGRCCEPTRHSSAYSQVRHHWSNLTL